MFFKTIERTQLHRRRKQKKTISSSKAGKADNSCHLQIVRKHAFPRDPWPPIFNADKREHAPLWPIRDPRLQLLTQSTGWPFASATLNAFKWKTWAQRSGWCAVAWKGGGGGVVPCQTLSHSPMPGNPMQSTLHRDAELSWAAHQGNTTLNLPVTPPNYASITYALARPFLHRVLPISFKTLVFSASREHEKGAACQGLLYTLFLAPSL